MEFVIELHHKTKTVEDKEITLDYYNFLLHEEIQKIKNMIRDEKYNQGQYKEAINIFNKMSTYEKFEEFLTLPAYERL